MARKKFFAPSLVPIIGRWAEQPPASILRELEKVADVDVRKAKHASVLLG